MVPRHACRAPFAGADFAAAVGLVGSVRLSAAAGAGAGSARFTAMLHLTTQRRTKQSSRITHLPWLVSRSLASLQPCVCAPQAFLAPGPALRAQASALVA